MIRAGRPAITDGVVALTHDALDARVRAWAAAVRALPDAGSHVAVDLPHGADGVAAWLGVLAAGRACLALDGTQPAAVRAAQLAFADARVLIATDDDARALRAAGWDGVVVRPSASPDIDLPPPDPDGPACLHFTSGSGGAPKAVVWTHRTLARAAGNIATMFALAADDRHALLSPLAVAATAAQVVAARRTGACLCLRDARRASPAELATWLRTERITTLQTVPSLFRTVAGDASSWAGVRALKLGGESVTPADARRFAACAAPGAVLINGLGITEAGFNVCWHRWTAGDALDGVTVPIGRPGPDVELALDGDEILVRSPDLARGFWRDDARTAARYRDVPGRPGWRELRTGDAGRLRPDGALEHAGRLDALVKVRGHRVDPAEVESALLAVPGVREAAVVPDGQADGRLVAFVGGVALGPATVRRALAASLPAAMVPATIRVVETLPRLPTGKVDRRALPAWAPAPDAAGIVAPRDALERTLHASFRRVLPEQAFGITESFFDLGGDSLAAAELMAALATVLHVELPLAALTRSPSVETLAARIREGGWNLTDEPVTLLSPAPARDATNLFVWPGAGSDVMALGDLARHLGEGVALHAIQHRGADGRRVWDTRLADMADRGVALVRRVQPRGPYALCGTSFGGLVALEVARRLRAAGEDVPVLAMLDTYAPGYPAVRRDLGVADRLRLARRALRPLGHKDEPGWPTLRRGLREQALRLRARLALRRPRPDAEPLPPAIRYVYLQEACFRASRSVRLAPYDGPVDLYRVDSPPPAALFALDDALGWRPFVSGPLRIDVIPGRHSWHLREPNVQTLAAKLRASLAGAGTAPGAWDAGRLWDGLASWWNEHVGDAGSAAFRATALAALERLIDVRPGERVLDVACGTGWLARRLADRGGVVTGVDVSDGMLRHAREQAVGRAVDFRRMDVTRPTEWARLDADAYDVAVCNLAVHDLSDVGPLFGGLPRTLRPSGRFVVGLVHPEPLLRDGVAPHVPTPRLAVAEQPRPHVEVTRPLSHLWRLAAEAGWRVETVVELPSADAPAFALALLRR